MNADFQLKLQAHLDGELPASERRTLAAVLATDPQARALLTELEMTQTALATGELARKVPETREFYWSKIAREIERQDAAARPATARTGTGWWRRWLVPVASAATVALVLSIAARWTPAGGNRYLVETTLADPGAITYHDAQTGVTLVWFSYPADAGDRVE